MSRYFIVFHIGQNKDNTVFYGQSSVTVNPGEFLVLSEYIEAIKKDPKVISVIVINFIEVKAEELKIWES